MNRKQKIIISVTGIFIVMLILVGLTYAYFLTQITGNTKDKSISVTTANLIVRYEDGTNIILDENTKLKPSSNAIGTKTFDVVNEGDEADYVVIVDNISIKNATTGESTTFKTNDFVYTLECTSSDGNDCSDVKTQSTLPLKNESILIGNRMNSGVTHSYTLTLWYLDSGENQSDDMNKTLDVRINIEDIRRLDNPYKDNTNSLAYNIYNNSLNVTNGTQLQSASITSIGNNSSEYIGNEIATESHGFYGWDNLTYGLTQEIADGNDYDISPSQIAAGTDPKKACESVIGQYISDYYNCINDCSSIGKVADCTADGTPILANRKLGESEVTLTFDKDDYGISYYYRGDIKDNYLNFAGKCWRIVRIDGNGNIKIILEDYYNECPNSNGMYWSIPASDGYTITMLNDKPYTLVEWGYNKVNNKYRMNYLSPEGNPRTALINALKYFQGQFTTDELGKIKQGEWCFADKGYSISGYFPNYTYELLDSDGYNYDYSMEMAYDSYVRLSGYSVDGDINPTLKCTGKSINTYEDNTPMYVGLLTSDEIIYAGGKYGDSNVYYYLTNDYHKKHSSAWWTMSPSEYDYLNDGDRVLVVSSNGEVTSNQVHALNSLRPAISLKAGVEIINGGEGTKTNPYVIK